MTYEETLKFLYDSLPAYQRIGKAAYKDNLDTTVALDTHFGSPHLNYKTIHIAGTNGKGSVSNIITSVLIESGLKTGLYTSPHLRDFRERIRVNGKMVSKDYVVNFVDKNREVIEKLKPSFFEMTVSMAFQYFADMGVDIAVVETGMGGRLDSTNIVNPLISVITNIGLDHTQFLGSTKSLIAIEKAGIIKKGIPVVIGRTDPETEPLFRKFAAENGSEINFADQQLIITEVARDNNSNDLIVTVMDQNSCLFKELQVNLAGNYQLENILTSINVIKLLQPLLEIGHNDIIAGMRNIGRNTNLEGRWQIINRAPTVICDTAHNYDGLIIVINQLNEYEKERLRIIMGFVDDKDINPILNLFPKDAIYYFTRSSVPRSLDQNKLAEIAGSFGLVGSVHKSVDEAYSAALSDASASDLIFVGGSTFVVADLLEKYC